MLKQAAPPLEPGDKWDSVSEYKSIRVPCLFWDMFIVVCSLLLYEYSLFSSWTANEWPKLGSRFLNVAQVKTSLNSPVVNSLVANCSKGLISSNNVF